ncbi:R.Pab1 family restriction endonuclease [Dehalococcoidia bacterium]|nr:R.Pab1 family restriction endonuclease [Dehalococcoidia bacterium]
MPEYCDVEYANERLVCHLPITTLTSKVRVLRANQPVATRQTPLQKDDIVEWQISYFADEHTRLVELGRLLDLAYRHNLIAKHRLSSFLTEIRAQREFFAEKYAITLGEFVGEFYGFNVLRKQVPILVKEVNGVLVWVELRHKQRAVGFQPMLYLRIPMQAVSPSLVGQVAGPRQIVTWQPTPSILFPTAKAFSIASGKHKADMVSIVEYILQH